MYVTAHRVRSPDGAGGINAFLYEHEAASLPEALDVEAVVENPPGRCVLESLQVRPGGNFIDSYIDVVAPDDIDVRRLTESLRAMGAKLPAERDDSKRVLREADVLVRFSSTHRIPGDARAEFQALSTAACRIVEEHRRQQRSATLVIFETRADDGGSLFRLSPEALELLGDAGLREQDVEVRMSHDVRQDLEATWGSIYPLLPDLLLDPSSDGAGYFHNIHVVDALTNTIVWTTEAPT